MATTTQLDLDYCYWQLRQHITQKDVPWQVVKNKALLAKIAIDKALGTQNIYSQWLVQIMGDIEQSNDAPIDPTITLRLANLVNSAIRVYDTTPQAQSVALVPSGSWNSPPTASMGLSRLLGIQA